jgi:hypothetical protein
VVVDVPILSDDENGLAVVACVDDKPPSRDKTFEL